MATGNRQIVLAARPVGFPKETDFRLEEKPMPVPGPGEFLVQINFLSVDPYMRGRMNERESYAPSVKLGEAMVGGAVGTVAHSRNDDFPAGTIVQGEFGWREYAIADGKGTRIVDRRIGPISTALGVLGMPGLTAYFGLLDVCQPQSGESVLISGAAGAVGSVAGQIAKIKGCRVIGVAGSDDKLDYVTRELGFDDAFNYKKVDNYVAKLQALFPKGIDTYFDNVGGALTDAGLLTMNLKARIAICGQISQYNLEKPEMGPRLFWKLIEKRAKVEGFLITDYMARFREGASQLSEWYRAGQIKCREQFTYGIESAPQAFLGMLRANVGKQLVEVAKEA